MGRLEGRVALITGSGRGIGRATALKLASEGASIVVNDLDDASTNEVIATIEAGGGRVIGCIGSITEDGFGERFVNAALDSFGGLDIIVNNAGYTRDGLIQRQSDDQFQAMLDVHVTAPFRILRAAAEPIREMSRKEAAEGRENIRKVVNVSSISGTNGNPGQVNYSAAKSALIGITKTLAKEWGRYKVCVNCVAFGLIGTRLTQPPEGAETRFEINGRPVQAGIPADALERMRAAIPLGREGTPDEAAGSIYLMCAPESDYVSGQVLLVSGGLNF